MRWWWNELFGYLRSDIQRRDRAGAGGLLDEVNGPQIEGAQGGIGPLPGERRDHHDASRALLHDALDGGKPIEARHLDVERDDIRAKLLDALERLDAVVVAAAITSNRPVDSSQRWSNRTSGRPLCARQT